MGEMNSTWNVRCKGSVRCPCAAQGQERSKQSWRPKTQRRWRALSAGIALSIHPSMPSMGRCRSIRIDPAGASGVSSISTVTGAATLRSSPVPRPRGGRATITTHSRLVVLVSNENPSRSSLLSDVRHSPWHHLWETSGRSAQDRRRAFHPVPAVIWVTSSITRGCCLTLRKTNRNDGRSSSKP